MTAGVSAADTGVPHGHRLIAFADAVAGDDDEQLARARAELLAAIGAAGLVDAAGIVGFFTAIVRVADATGTPLDAKTAADTADFRRALGIDAFAAAKAGLE